MTKRWQLKRRDYDAVRARRREFRALLTERYHLADFGAHELVFGELVANAVRYGNEPMSVIVAVSDDGIVQIRVENDGDCFDLDRLLARSPATTAIGGRGLQIVRALVDTLRVEHSPAHPCQVTATLRLSTSSPSG